MKTLEAIRYRQRLDHLFSQVSTFSGDAELQSQWARYLCVLVSGFLEVSICAIYNQFTRQSASPHVANFVKCQLDSFQNPKMGKIIELTRAFNSEWANDLENQTNGKLKDHVDSIVANRHLIAHGKDVGITYHRIKDYYEDAIKVIDIIEKCCGI
jgi:hypothetical protein